MGIVSSNTYRDFLIKYFHSKDSVSYLVEPLRRKASLKKFLFFFVSLGTEFRTSKFCPSQKKIRGGGRVQGSKIFP